MPIFKVEAEYEGQSLTNGLKTAQKQLADTGNAVAKTDSQLAKLGKSGGQSIFNLTEKLRSLQSSVFTEKDINKIKSYNQQIVETEKKIQELETAGVKSTTAVTGGFSKAYGAARTLANIIPGIGIGGLVALLAEPLIELGKGLLGLGEVSEKVKKNQEEVAASFKNAADSVGEEISKVTVLKAVLESENSTRLQKATALKQLKELNFDYFGQLDIENGKVTGLGTAYDAYVGKLIKSINAKANIEQLTSALKAQNEVIGTINNNAGLTNEKYKASLLTQYQILDATRRFNLDFGAKKGQTPILDGTQLQLIADLLNAESRVKEITGRIKEQAADVFEPKPPKEIKLRVPKAKIEIEKVDYAFLKKGKANDVVTEIPTELKLKPRKVSVELGKAQGAFDEAELKKFRDGANEIVNNTLSGLFEGIGDAIGKGGNIFEGLFKTLGAGLRQLGAYFVKTAIAIDVFKKFIQKNPVLAIGIGVGLIALGSIISSQATKIPGFAGGVKNFRGGVAMVGELGPELVRLPQGSDVIPNNKLGSIGGGGQSVFIPSVTLRGQDLVIAFNKASKTLERNGQL